MNPGTENSEVRTHKSEVRGQKHSAWVHELEPGAVTTGSKYMSEALCVGRRIRTGSGSDRVVFRGLDVQLNRRWSFFRMDPVATLYMKGRPKRCSL